MSEKTRIGQSEDSRFVVVLHRGREDDVDEKFFGGWFCEVYRPGDEENETLCCEQELWVDRPEDGAVMFQTYREAADAANELLTSGYGGEIHVVLFGKGEDENSTYGSRWYPLKEFYGMESTRRW